MVENREPPATGQDRPTRRKSGALLGALIAVIAVGAGAAWLTFGGGLLRGQLPAGAPALAAPAGDPLRALASGRQWLNTPPLRAADLRGKVVLVNIWTYSCINSLRPLPYVRAWAKKYADRGLVVIGVHTPEFGFEKDIANVRRALADLGVGYPVVLDSDFGIWRAYDNSAWPAFYFVGADGQIHGKLLGEGRYDQSERLIQALLSKARHAPVTDAIVPIAGVGVQAAPDWKDLGSAETYVGYAKAQGFASDGGLQHDLAADYRAQAQLPLNHWSLAGEWTAGPEFTTLTGRAGAIAYRFHARDLNLVMTPPPDGRPVRFRVRIDGADPGADHGYDTDARGWGRLQAPRLYQLVRQSRAVADRTFEIDFLDPGARAYVFTFG